MWSAGLERVMVPAVLTFAAGGVLGFAFGSHAEAAPEPALAPDLIAYQAGTVHALALDDSQASDLRVLLYYYQQERNRLLRAQQVFLEPDLSDLDRRFELWIRTSILRPEQRARLDLQRTPQLLPAATSGG